MPQHACRGSRPSNDEQGVAIWFEDGLLPAEMGIMGRYQSRQDRPWFDRKPQNQAIAGLAKRFRIE